MLDTVFEPTMLASIPPLKATMSKRPRRSKSFAAVFLAAVLAGHVVGPLIYSPLTVNVHLQHPLQVTERPGKLEAGQPTHDHGSQPCRYAASWCS